MAKQKLDKITDTENAEKAITKIPTKVSGDISMNIAKDVQELGKTHSIHSDDNSFENMRSQEQVSLNRRGQELGMGAWSPSFTSKGNEKYIKDLQYQTEKKLSEEQGFVSELGNFLGQAVIGEIVLGTGEAAALLGGAAVSLIQGEKPSWDNDTAKFISGLKEANNEHFAIHVDPESKNRGLIDNLIHSDGWFFQNSVSMASTVAMMIPVMGAVRALSIGTNVLKAGTLGARSLAVSGKLGSVGIKGAKYGGKGIDWVLSTGGKVVPNATKEFLKTPAAKEFMKRASYGIQGGVISRDMESRIEAAQVYREKMDQYTSGPYYMTQEEAEKSAGKAAAFVYRSNAALVALDILQYGLLGAGFGKNSRMRGNVAVARAELKAGAGSKLKVAGAVGAVVGKTAFYFGSEGFEEYYQYGVSEEAKYISDVAAGIIKEDPNRDSGTIGRLQRSWDDSEAWTSAFFGGLGGLAFSTIGPKVKNAYNKYLGKGSENLLTEQQQALAEVQNRMMNINKSMSLYREAVENDNQEAAMLIQSMAIGEGAIAAAQAGNLGGFIDTLSKLKTMSEAERVTMGIDSENLDEFNNNIDNFIKQSQEAAVKYDSYISYYGDTPLGRKFAERSALTEVTSDHFANKLPEYEKALEEARGKVPLMNNKSVSAEAKSAFNQIINSKSFKARHKILSAQNKKLDPVADKQKIEKNNNTLNELETAIKNNEVTINSWINNENASSIDRQFLASANNKYGDDLFKAQLQHDLATQYIAETSETLAEYKQLHTDMMAAQKEAAKNKKKPSAANSAKDDQENIVEPQEESPSTDENFDFSTVTPHKLDNDPGLTLFIKQGLANGTVTLDEFTDETKQHLGQMNLVSTEEINETNTDPKVEEEANALFGTEEVENTEEVDTTSFFNKDGSLNENLEDSSNGEVTSSSNVEINSTSSESYDKNNSHGYIDFEISDNTVMGNWRMGDEGPVHITTGINTFAWKSTNNPEIKASEKTPMNIALTTYLEKVNTSIEGMTFKLSLNEEWLSKYGKTEEYSKMIEDINNGIIPENIGNVPIKAQLYMNGKPVMYSGLHLESSIHDSNFFFDLEGNPLTENSTQQAQAVVDLKTAVLNNLFTTGNTTSVNVVDKSRGVLNTTTKNNNVSQVVGKKPSELTFVYGNNDNRFANPTLNRIDKTLSKFTSASNGAIYTIIRDSKGEPFPLRMQSSRVTKDEASLIFEVYREVLGKSSVENPYTTRVNTKISDEIIEMIEKSSDPRVNQIFTIISKGATYQELLSVLVHDGASLNKLKNHSLFMTSKDGVAYVRYGERGIINAKDLFNSKAKAKKEFITHLTTHKNKNINVNMLSNGKYKEYIVNTNSITSSMPTVSSGESMFIQPTLTFSTADMTLSDKYEASEVSVVESNKSETSSLSTLELYLETLNNDLAYENSAEFKNQERIDEISNLINETESRIEQLKSKYSVNNNSKSSTKKDEIDKIEKERQDELDNLGKKNVQKRLQDLRGAINDDKKVLAIFRIEKNIDHGAAITKEEKEFIEKEKQQLKDKGIEIRVHDNRIVNFGDNVVRQNVSHLEVNETLSLDEIKAVEKELENRKNKRQKLLNKGVSESEIDGYFENEIGLMQTVEPTILTNGKMTKAGKVDVKYISLEIVDSILENSRKNPSKTKKEKVNIKYDAKIAALDNVAPVEALTTPSNSVALNKLGFSTNDIALLSKEDMNNIISNGISKSDFYKNLNKTANTKIEEGRNKGLFPDTTEFANVIGDSNQTSVLSGFKTVRGVGISEYTNPNNNLVDVIMSGTSGNNYVGYIRIYENGKPTNRWTSKMENKSQNKENLKTMITEVQALLPENHEYTEKTNISLDGLRTYKQQLNFGYDILTDVNGNIQYNQITLNKANINDILNAKTQEESQSLYDEYTNLTREEYNNLKEKISNIFPEVKVLPFNESRGDLVINLPVLVSNKTKINEKGDVAKEVNNDNSVDDNSQHTYNVTEIFNDNPELSNIGSEQDYNNYLNTVFPESKVQDIVYHGSPHKYEIFDSKFSGSVTGGNHRGFYFTDGIRTAKYYQQLNIPLDAFETLEEYEAELKKSSSLHAVKLNIDVLHITKDIQGTVNTTDIKENTGYKTDEPIEDTNNSTDDYANQFVVYKPEQIHILGSQADIKGFTEYVNKKSNINFEVKTNTQIETLESFRENLMNSNKTSYAKLNMVIGKDNKEFTNLSEENKKVYETDDFMLFLHKERLPDINNASKVPLTEILDNYKKCK